MSVAAYERDRTPDARLQGYRLSIEPPGSAALHDCLLPELWQILVATSGGLRGKALREVVEQRMARWHPVQHRSPRLALSSGYAARSGRCAAPSSATDHARPA